MAFFHLKLVAPRPTFPFDATEPESAAMTEHFSYWQAQADSGAAIAVAPVFDERGPYGMAVVEVEDEAAAKALGDADPVVSAELGFAYIVSPIPSLILRA